MSLDTAPRPWAFSLTTDVGRRKCGNTASYVYPAVSLLQTAKSEQTAIIVGFISIQCMTYRVFLSV